MLSLPRVLGRAAWVIAVVALAALAVTWNIKTQDVILLPSPAEPVDPRLAIAGHPRPPHRGTLYFTFVSEEQGTLLTEWYHRTFDPNADIVSLHTLYGPQIPTPAQQQQEGQAQMMDSKTQAEVAAFRALGYHIPLQQHVAIAAVSRQSDAVGKLQGNDVILRENGQPVQTPADAIRIVRAVRPGTVLPLVVQRVTGGKTRMLTVRVRTHAAADGRTPQIGISLVAITSVDPHRLPYNVTINTGAIGGPSAGLMFALGIINRLSPQDLTHGQKIAGTGTISADGSVGPIGGAKQKVVGARDVGARYFFVPAYCTAQVCNAKEAQPVAHGITLVPVRTLDEAVSYLRRLH